MATGFLAGAVVGKLMLDKSKWSQSINDVKGDEKKMTGMAGSMGAGFTKMGAAMTVAGGLVVAGLGKMLSKYVEAGDEIDKMSKRTGFAATTLSELAYAADISGASLTDVEKGVKKMSKTIVDAAEGMTTYERAFERIGLSSAELAGLGIEDQFFKIAEAIAKVEDPTIKAATAQDIFGRAGTKLLPLFDEGEKGMAALAAEAHKLGIIFDEEAAAKAAKLKDAQTALKGAVTGLGMTLAEKLIPALTSFALKITDIIAKVTAWAKAHPGLFSAITKIVGALGGVMVVLGPILIILPKLAAGFGMLKVAMTAALGPIGLVITALGALAIGYMKVKSAQDAYEKAAARAGEAEDNLFKKLKKSADQAGLTEQEFLKLRDAYNGNAAAMAMAIKRGEEGVELQEALTDVSKEHKEEIDKQKKAYENTLGPLENYQAAITEVTEKAQTWIDFMKDVGLKTLDEKKKRVGELEGVLAGLDQAYKDGKISIEDYTEAVTAAKNEMIDLVPPTAIGNARDLTGVLDQVADSMDTVAFATLTGEQQMIRFASQTGQSVWEVRQKIYDLAQSMMALSGIYLPDLVISNKAAWSQIAQEPPKARSEFDKVADGLRTKWTTELSAMLQGTTSWKDAINGLWGSVKSQFFDMVAGMIAKWSFDLLQGLLTGSGGLLDTLTAPFKGLANALTGSEEGTGAGGIFGNLTGGEGAGGFLGAIGKMAGPIGIGLLAAKFLDLEAIGQAVSETLVSAFEAIGGVITGLGDIASSVLGAGANIISGIGGLVGGLTTAFGLLGGGGKQYSEITYWLDLLWIEARETWNTLQGIKWWAEHQGKSLQDINQSTQKVEEIMDGRMTLWVGNIAKRMKKVVDALTKKGTIYTDVFRSAVIEEMRIKLENKLTTLEKMKVVSERMDRVDKRTAERTKRLESRLIDAEGKERKKLQDELKKLHDRAQQRRQKLIDRMQRLEEKAAKEAKQDENRRANERVIHDLGESIDTSFQETTDHTIREFSGSIMKLSEDIGANLTSVKGEIGKLELDSGGIIEAIDRNREATENVTDAVKSIKISRESPRGGEDKENGEGGEDGKTIDGGKKVRSAQLGAILTEPQLVMTHGTPAIPEVIAPVPALAGILAAAGGAGKQVNIDIRNEIYLQGTMITDREYARTRLIPEMVTALDNNSDFIRRKFRRILGI